MNNLENEIAEQAELMSRFGANEVAQIEKVAKIFEDVSISSGRAFLFASGSSLNACLYARELFSRDNDMTLEVFPAGEATNHADDIKQDDLVVLVSQSGESGDILGAESLIEGNIKKIIITNNPDSKLTEGADIVLDLKAGEEKSVPATKTYFSTLIAFTMISEVLNGGVKILESIEQVSGEIKKISGENMDWVEEIKDKKIFILGSGVMWPQAMEAELKFKEISKSEAESFEMSEFMHGPQTMLDGKSLVIMLCPSSCGSDGVVFLDKAQKTGAKILAVGTCDGEKPEYKIKLENKKYYELISMVVMQKMALELAKVKGINLEDDAEIEKVVK